jgi:peroxiredoxin family protein
VHRTEEVTAVRLIKSKQGLLAIGALVAVFLIFAGMAFVQSQEVKTAAATATAVNAGGTCPASKDAMAGQASGMPGSCSELHAQALAAGKMTQPDYEAATAMLASATTESNGMTAEQCKEAMAKLGYECNETDLKACAQRLQALGLCKGMTADECATQLTRGLCTSADPARCAAMKAAGGCCATMTKSADAGGADVQAAAATQTTDAGKPKQCDWTKGNCGPEAGANPGE